MKCMIGKTLAAMLAVTVLVGASHAAIVVESTGVSTEEQGNYILDPETVTWSAASFGSFDLSAADKLVVTFSIRHSGTPASIAISNVTYNGQSMTEAVGSGANDASESAIWYLDNPGTLTGNLVADMGRGYGAGATLWALSGTADGVGNTGSSAGNSTSLTTTGTNSLVIAHTTYFNGTSDIPDAQVPLTDGPGAFLEYDTSGTRLANHNISTGYQTVALSGTSVTPTFDIGNTTVAAEFTADVVVPEPASLLSGLFGLTLIAARRRR